MTSEVFGPRNAQEQSGWTCSGLYLLGSTNFERLIVGFEATAYATKGMPAPRRRSISYPVSEDQLAANSSLYVVITSWSIRVLSSVCTAVSFRKTVRAMRERARRIAPNEMKKPYPRGP